MNTITTAQLQEALLHVCDVIIDAEGMLTELDTIIGDGDHGIGMKTGFSALRTLLQEQQFSDTFTLLKESGLMLIKVMGGTSGVIFGTMFIGGLSAVKDKDPITVQDFAEYIEKSAKKYNDNVVIISRPPDNGTTEEDLIDYYTALGNSVTHPVIIQTGGGERYRGVMPSVKMLVEIANRFPKTFGYVKEESGNASSRIVEEIKEKPVIKTVFSAMGGSQWLYQGRKLGSEGLITERPAYADLVAYIWRQMENGDENGTLDDAFSKLLLMINAETIFPGESLRTGMRCPHIYLLKKRGIFKNCISRAWEIKDGHRVVPETPIVVDMEMTSEQQDEVEKRFESLKPYLNNLQI